jgi:hypothetical protein
MKILTYSLLIFGFVLLASAHPSAKHPNLPIMTIGAGMTMVAVILMWRLRLTSSKSQVADKDRAQVKEMRGVSGIRKLLANVTAVFGFLFFMSGASYPLYADSHPDLGWRDAIKSLLLCALFWFCSWLLMRRSRL